jgi:hypothetical protein
LYPQLPKKSCRMLWYSRTWKISQIYKNP